MSREIKFRAWDSTNKEMTTDWMVFINGEVKAGPVGHFVMQYTGLKDKNDKEIYEGDIVRDYYGDYQLVEIVEDQGYIGYLSDLERGEIIGNIYENPELREAK